MNRCTHGWIPGFLAAVLAGTVAGCASSRPLPPRAVAEVRPEKPHPDAVWMQGHWQWSGRNSGYRWVPGRWTRAGVASRNEP